MTQETPTPSRTEKLQRLRELAALQAGHFTAVQARELGFSHRSLVHHVTSGNFERVNRGFYRLVDVPAGPHDDIVAEWLKLASRGAVVSHETALALYDLAPSRSHKIHLTVPREQRPRTRQTRKAVRVHTTLTPPDRAEVSTRFGVRLTTPARTVADVAQAGADPSVVIEAVDRALATGLVTGEELHDAAAGRSARVRRLIDRAVEEANA